MSEGSGTGPRPEPGVERPGRYPRTAGGLVGSMIVLVLVVIGIVLFRGAFRDTPEYQPEDIDYLAVVYGAQQRGETVVYPPAIPAGWSTKAASEPGDPSFDLVFTTDDQHTAGVHQADASTHDELDTYVGEDATENGDTLTTPLGTWTGWDDTDGDHAWTTDLGDDTVLVYSSGDAGVLRSLVESLTTAKLTPDDISSSTSTQPSS